MIYRLCGESFDGKRVRDDLDGSSGGAILAHGAGLRGLCFRLHGIFSTDVSTRHRKKQEGYRMVEYKMEVR
jgi:hypothetical protein